MSNAKKLTFNMIAAEISHDSNVECIQYIGEHKQYDIAVKRTLDFNDAMRFVMDIVNSCSDEKTSNYSPEGFDFAARVNTLIYYAGFVVPSDIYKAYDVVYRTELFNKIYEIIDRTQFNVLIKAAKDKLAYMRDAFLSSQASKINELVSKMDAIMDDGNAVVAALNSDEMRSKIDDMMHVVTVMASGPENAQQERNDADSKIVALPGRTDE